jgi:hypothetical protein
MRTKYAGILLLVCAAVAFTAFAYPMYVIRPFRAQGSAELLAALFVKRWAPLVSFVAASFAVFAAVMLWRRGGPRWMRILGGVAALVTIAFAGFTRVNVYEMMFHRIDSPHSVAATAAKLDAEDMVLAINVEGYGRAYPIRMMGYHHIVNDRIGRTPIVATY